MSFWKKKPKKRLKPKAKVSASQSPPINKPKMETRQPEPSHIECGKIPHYKEKQKIMPPVKRLDSKKEFLDIFDQLTYRHRRWDVWSDFVVMFACALSNPLDKSHFNEREKRYLKIIKKYDKREQQLFPDLAAHTVMALEENPEQDFLGDIYMKLNLGSQTRGQFFTPYSISRLMAEMTVDDVASRVEKDGYITIGDSCCGGGFHINSRDSCGKRTHGKSKSQLSESYTGSRAGCGRDGGFDVLYSAFTSGSGRIYQGWKHVYRTDRAGRLN